MRYMDARDFIRSNSDLPPKHAKSVTMTVPAPHFLLFSEARSTRTKAMATAEDNGLWHFVLESVDGEMKLEATDEEADVDPERLELLAVVRGLEALDQPSHVTLVTRSRSVTRGLRFGIDRWRESGWHWECFGRMTPIKDSDLWQRIDHALQFHSVRCRTWRFDPPEESTREPKHLAAELVIPRSENNDPSRRFTLSGWLRACFHRFLLSIRRPSLNRS